MDAALESGIYKIEPRDCINFVWTTKQLDISKQNT